MGQKIVGANFYAFCNYASHVTTTTSCSIDFHTKENLSLLCTNVFCLLSTLSVYKEEILFLGKIDEGHTIQRNSEKALAARNKYKLI